MVLIKLLGIFFFECLIFYSIKKLIPEKDVVSIVYLLLIIFVSIASLALLITGLFK